MASPLFIVARISSIIMVIKGDILQIYLLNERRFAFVLVVPL